MKIEDETAIEAENRRATLSDVARAISTDQRGASVLSRHLMSEDEMTGFLFRPIEVNDNRLGLLPVAGERLWSRLFRILSSKAERPRPHRCF
jgi:hypothetical protein